VRRTSHVPNEGDQLITVMASERCAATGTAAGDRRGRTAVWRSGGVEVLGGDARPRLATAVAAAHDLSRCSSHVCAPPPPPRSTGVLILLCDMTLGSGDHAVDAVQCAAGLGLAPFGHRSDILSNRTSFCTVAKKKQTANHDPKTNIFNGFRK
jgi:hypothetical protein